MGNIVTDGSTAGWLPDAKIADPDRTLDHPEWQISHDDFNDLTSAADVIASHLCGEPDVSGAWFLGGYAQTADPLTATLAGLGTGRWHMWPDSTDDAWKFRESGETAERLIFDDHGVGVLQIPVLGVAPAVAPADTTRLYSDGADVFVSHDGGAYAALAGGGGLSSPVGAADGGTGITSYAVGDIIYASAATTLSKLAAVGVGQVLASAGVTTAPAYTATPTLTTLGLAAGSTAACSLYATGDANTGIYFPAADQIAIVSGGTARVVIDGSTELHSLIQTGPAGSASLPTYGFTGDPNTGAYSVGADQYGITVGGTLRTKIGTSYARFALNGGTYADSSAFEVVTGGAGADGRARFQNTLSATGVGGIIAANDSGGALTALLDGTSTTRSGVAGGSFFVGISSGAHFGALTNTDSHWITGTADSTADRVASAVYNAGNRYLNIGYFMQFSEMAAPATPDANKARLYLWDDAGTTTLSVIWPSGSVSDLAFDPGP